MGETLNSTTVDRGRPALPSPDPTPPGREKSVFVSGVAVSSPSTGETPPTPPLLLKGGELTRKRVRARRPRPANIRDVRRHIEAATLLKTGRRFIWTPLYRANLRRLMINLRACEVMALWDLYLELDRSVYRIYYMERERDRLWLDPRFKPLVRKYDEFLIHLGRRT